MDNLDLSITRPAPQPLSALASSAPAALELVGFGLAFGAQTVLDGLNLHVPDAGIQALTGPQGAGKSSLLRTLVGLHEGYAHFRCWGQAFMLGKPLAKGWRPALVRQDTSVLVGRVRDALARQLPMVHTGPLSGPELMQQTLEHWGVAAQLKGGMDAAMLAQSAEVRRQINIVAHMLARPTLLLLDEPFAGLAEPEAHRLAEWLRRIRPEQRMLLALSDEAQARRFADHAVWLGRPACPALRPRTPAPCPLAQSPTADASTGVSRPAKPARKPATLPRRSRRGAEAASMVGRAILSEYRAPVGFHWIDPGKLAACVQPGVVRALDYDLGLLKDVGVTYLITLTERDLDPAALAEAGLENLHLPVQDGGAPSISQAYMLVHRMQQLLNQGHTVAAYCKAGLGRTGTLFAAWLMREGGLSAQTAIARLRAINRAYVQSGAQEAFLLAFEKDLQGRAAAAAL